MAGFVDGALASLPLRAGHMLCPVLCPGTCCHSTHLQFLTLFLVGCSRISRILVGFSIVNHPYWGRPILGTPIIKRYDLQWHGMRKGKRARTHTWNLFEVHDYYGDIMLMIGNCTSSQHDYRFLSNIPVYSCIMRIIMYSKALKNDTTFFGMNLQDFPGENIQIRITLQCDERPGIDQRPAGLEGSPRADWLWTSRRSHGYMIYIYIDI